MTTDLHKSANFLQKIDLSHQGILTASTCQRHCDLHCYEPPADLAPFVVHFWVQRRNKKDIAYRSPLEIQTGPNIYLFVSTSEAYIHGIHMQSFSYDASRTIWAGVKFRPGGFYAFWRQSTSKLRDAILSADTIFPDINGSFCQKLDSMSNDQIVDNLVCALRAHSPQGTPKLQQVQKSMELLSSSDTATIPNVAHCLGIGERTLQALFREYVGISPQWVLSRRRLIATIAESGNSTWTTIAASHGYSSQSHFIRTFKNATGISPSMLTD